MSKLQEFIKSKVTRKKLSALMKLEEINSFFHTFPLNSNTVCICLMKRILDFDANTSLLPASSDFANPSLL
jgi:hypothetical protein